MAEESKMIQIQVPDEIIKNTYSKLDANTFACYVYLKYLYFRKNNNSELKIDHNHFKHKLFVSDNRTLKKCFEKLHKSQFVLEYISSFPTKGHLELTFDPVPFDSKTFTQLPVTIINKIEHIGTFGMRLLFYYESFINRTDVISKQFAFPAIETAAQHLGVNRDTIITYNEILKENKLIKITKHELKNEGQYEDLDKPMFTKYNNHYYVQLNKLGMKQ